MSDLGIRDLLRRWQATGAGTEEAAYYTACARAGVDPRVLLVGRMCVPKHNSRRSARRKPRLHILGRRHTDAPIRAHFIALNCLDKYVDDSTMHWREYTPDDDWCPACVATANKHIRRFSLLHLRIAQVNVLLKMTGSPGVAPHPAFGIPKVPDGVLFAHYWRANAGRLRNSRDRRACTECGLYPPLNDTFCMPGAQYAAMHGRFMRTKPLIIPLGTRGPLDHCDYHVPHPSGSPTARAYPCRAGGSRYRVELPNGQAVRVVRCSYHPADQFLP